MYGRIPETEEFELLKLEIELMDIKEAEKEIKRLDRCYISEKSRRLGLQELKERKEELKKRIAELEGD